MNKDFISRFGPLFFAVGGAILVLWQLLLPGYVLTWDMVLGPSHTLPVLTGLLNALPLRLFMWGMGYIAPMWIVQKGILVALFFSLFYLPLKFFPASLQGFARYAGATLFAVNPFVYERFLAGQWGVLAAYALLMPLTYFLFELIESPKRKAAIYLTLTMLLIGIFSLHTFVMSILVVSVVVALALPRQGIVLLKSAALAGGLVAIGSLYWLVPLALNPAISPVPRFDEAHREAFATAIDPVVFGNAAGNVAMLYGFWGESYPWMQTLLSPKDVLPVFLPALLALTVLIGVGIVRTLRAQESRQRAIALVAIGAAAFVFSMGVAPSMFQTVNVWLFQHVPFWAGFRDTQKWSMWLALAYSYFFAAGAGYFLARVRVQYSRVLGALLVLIPLFYTFPMLGGFMGQLRALEYPATWYEANAILAEDPECKALFLPWHQYYWLSLNDGRLTSNPASKFFDCEMITSQDAEIGEIGDQGNTDPSYRAIAGAVTSNDPQSIDATISVLRSVGIRYIVFTDDIRNYDGFSYSFLGSPELSSLYHETVDNQDLAVFKL
ncbi:hypothetical protein HY417_01200 [Candidatus Kaiserbacteria bacterium]|nr:hypothetical protein [Candidatus Kaiserbacteria bacterium]